MTSKYVDNVKGRTGHVRPRIRVRNGKHIDVIEMVLSRDQVPGSGDDRVPKPAAVNVCDPR
jgi:hypothetical protein